MGQSEMIDTIGRVMVDKEFRVKFEENANTAIDAVRGLKPEEKIFLKNNSNRIRDLAKALNVDYSGESKRN